MPKLINQIGCVRAAQSDAFRKPPFQHYFELDDQCIIKTEVLVAIQILKIGVISKNPRISDDFFSNLIYSLN